MWEDIRKFHLNKLNNALENGEVDKGIIPLLIEINKIENFVTRSSCYGRVSFTLEKSLIRKGKGKILYKFHQPIDIKNLQEVTSEVAGLDGILWMNIEGTIIHVACKSLEDAIWLYSKAVESGYEDSSIYSISGRGITVEILLSKKYSLPIFKGNMGYLVHHEDIENILEYIRKRFKLIEEAKHRLINVLSEY